MKTIIQQHKTQEPVQLRDVCDLRAGTIYVVGPREETKLRGRLIIKVQHLETNTHSFHYIDTGEIQTVTDDILVTPIYSCEITYRI